MKMDNYISDDEEPMEVDDPYISDDAELFTDDEDDLVRVLSPRKNLFVAPKSKCNGLEMSRLAEEFAAQCLKKLNQLDAANNSNGQFPEQYRFLLNLPSINDYTLRQYPDLYSLVFSKPTTVEKIIDKVVAILCVEWANDFNQTSRPLLKDITMNFLDSRTFQGKTDQHKSFSRIVFGIDYTDQNCIESRNRLIRNRMRVLVEPVDGEKVVARVTKAGGNYCELTVKCPAEQELGILKLDNSSVCVYEILQEFVLKSMLNSIESMKQGFLNHIIIPQPQFEESHRDYLSRKDRDMRKFMRRYGISPLLTPSQQDAVFAICNDESKRLPFVLFGPPGTGKTFTISQTIQAILKMNDKNRVLVCTASNMASDRVAEQLMEDFGEVLNEYNVLRLRALGNDYQQRERRFDEIHFCNPDLERFEIPRNFDQWRVVVCTLECSTHISLVKEDMRGFFSHIMIDEAGQASEARMWIPIGTLATSETSVILCGDPKQLGPVTKLDIPKRLQDTFISPLFRYMDIYEYKHDKRLCCQLVDCFRCPAVLVSIISALFYADTLKSTRRAVDTFDYSGLEMSARAPMLFVSVDSQEERQPNGSSHGNPIEANICVQYVNFLINHKGVEPKDIGIISPYTYQQRVILGLLRKDHQPHAIGELVVGSVERLQGSERDVIIMTATRTGHLGFMADDQRVNTSLTRAKKQLIVIGNEKALERHASWKHFISYCKELNAFKKWNPRVDPQFGDDDIYVLDDFSNMQIG